MTGRYLRRSMRNISPVNCLKDEARWLDHSRRLRFTKNYNECCVMLRAIAPRHVNVWLNLNCYAL
ncbi:hypothetical protein ALP33_01042 [Pseudomonas amygdali pv. lachrymans]|uniref:Uncharacterized protein n=2 Tax=Pseudomonas amygdali TaxID=47877 RepID=A0A0Q0BT37_PSEAJ|nr:Uncharacterized protein AC501_3754 [Pseudomonas amygdali pv. lachrymans]KPY81494.1 Uncharacterized protein ALO60_00619 [Pseudomonas amygdali pv. tabaci]KPC16177.1 Uncharacterized protein AC499_1611 [Pseudomonas amygdali pv. lachrymans]KPX64572.1 Uncharacterized protein ALO35_01391 [Pseudomonas amygdali pv. lachrymans]RML81294.1 hypothetical protein ALQ89_100364 [Pseudomonas amygdali pv. tabaci]